MLFLKNIISKSIKYCKKNNISTVNLDISKLIYIIYYFTVYMI